MKRSPLKRKGATLKRGAIKRRSKPRDSRGRLRPESWALMHAFSRAAGRQPGCAISGCRERDFDSHHVLYEQHLRREGLPRWDPRNCLRLCRRHHELHHKAAQRIPRSALRAENVAYILESLGPGRGEGYLARYYP